MLTNEAYMRLAIEEAKKSGIDVPIGAVVVKNGEILSIASNKKELNNDVSAHAEIIALKEAAQKTGDWRLTECKLYVTLEPCPMCATAIINSRVSEVFFGAYDNLYGALGSVLDLRKVFNSKLNVQGGILEDECSLLLREFWRKNEKS